MVPSFDPDSYGPAFARVLGGDRRRPLTGVTSGAFALEGLADLTVDGAFAHTRVVDQDAARCCLSACWLLADELDRSHAISQAIDTAEGSWWHGIMHRCEGDFGNSKYWFRRVGSHPVVDRLAERFSGWDSYAFVDACQRAVHQGEGVDACLDRQQAEWETLFDWCYTKATK